MTKLVRSALRHYVETIFLEALKAVDPRLLMHGAIQTTKGKLQLGEISLETPENFNAYLIAMGKAAGGMTQAFLEKSKLQPSAGIVALPASNAMSTPHPLSVFYAGHPHPNQASIDAGHAAQALLNECRKEDIVFVLISGGGSALFELPIPGIELEDLHQINELLLRSGLSINKVNIIRSALSQVKAGGLARMAHPARVMSLILSDVIGDPLGSIASGPTVLSPDRWPQARRLLTQSELWPKLPERVRNAFDSARPPRGRARRPTNILLGGNRQLINAAEKSAESLGFVVSVLSRQMRGEARHVGRKFARRLIKLSREIDQPTCLIMGGETTVTVLGSGRGGRNQELVLAASPLIAGYDRIALASLASDGVDGPTDAAGGIIDGHTYTRICASDLDPETALEQNDSYAALQYAEALFHTGPTGTNVADLTLGLVLPA